MRIGVISDTHIPRTTRRLPEKIYKDFERVDMILHAGDLTEFELLNQLRRLAPTTAVYGNMDDALVRSQLSPKEVIDIGKFKLGLIHGSGPPFGLMDRVREEFGKVDIIVYGHSHSPKNETHKEILFFNPGSPTDKIFTKHNTYGILEINNTVKGEIIRL